MGRLARDYGTVFEWDSNKAERNFRQHRVRFETAVGVFADPYLIYREDDRFTYGERRFRALGAVDGGILRDLLRARRERDSRHLGKEGDTS